MESKERYWTFVVYPESVKEDWQEILQNLGLQCAISPLHDKDINANGENKKAHYHVLLCFNGPTTYNKVKTICDSIGATIPQRVLSCVGIIRYFTHKDNPEKYQYNEEEIKTINGLDLRNFNDLTESQILHIKKDIIKLINEYNIKYYYQLVNMYVYNSSMLDYFRVVSNNTLFFNNYLKSRKDSIYEDRQKLTN